MALARNVVNAMLRHFTTDQSVRTGVITAAWAAAASYSRGLLPRTPVQQAAVTGVSATAYYSLGATTWATVSSIAAGVPGSRPGVRARLTAAAVTAAGGKAGESLLRPHSGDNLAMGVAWSEMKLLSVAGLAGGLVTVSDVIAHDVLKLKRSPGTTLALDVGMGLLMAAGSVVRRNRRAAKYHVDSGLLDAVKKSDDGTAVAIRARTAAVAGATVAGSAVGLAALATTEQAGARLLSRALNASTHRDLGEFSDFVGHGVMFAGFTGIGLMGLRYVRAATQAKSEVIEPGYREPPTSPHVSAGPNSAVEFEAIGKEGRRFVLMQLTTDEITTVMGAAECEPVRAVIPREGSVQQRAELAVRELEALGGLDRSVICIASPTGVGYVNYVMAEALEYLTRGDCAVVVPQYAYVPSALALNKTDEGVELQTAVIDAVRERLLDLPLQDRPRIVNFGESLGAQVAVDVAGPQGSSGFEQLGLDSGLYLGVPFRSALWKHWLDNSEAMGADGRLLNVADSRDLSAAPGRHVMINHHDDPINMFSYEMVVCRPWWFGAPDTRPPGVPPESLFRPVTSFVIALVDLLNGMNSKPGEFVRRGHDYRIDIGRGIEFAYHLPATPEERERIEEALRAREQEWAELRLIARTGEKALRQLRETLNAWGEDIVNITVDEKPTDEASSKLLDYLNARLGQSGSSGAA